MQHIFHSLKKALKKKGYDQQTLARLLLNKVMEYVDTKSVLQGYLKRSQLYIYHDDQQFAIKLFADKKNILTYLNNCLNDLEYDFVLRDVRVVPQRDEIQWVEEGLPWHGVED